MSPARRTPPVANADQPAFFVYYLHGDDGDTLYVGRSGNVARRIRQHHFQAVTGGPLYWRKGTWLFAVRSVSMIGPFTWDWAIATERSEITRLQPVGNIRHTTRDVAGVA